MTIYNHISRNVTRFHNFPTLEEGTLPAGYSALIGAHNLQAPLPDFLCAIGTKHKKHDHARWHIFTPRHKPADTLYGHLTFALKYEGIDLAIFNALFQKIDGKAIQQIILSEPTEGTAAGYGFYGNGCARNSLILRMQQQEILFLLSIVNYNMKGNRPSLDDIGFATIYQGRVIFAP
jgi:hypothetical protein